MASTRIRTTQIKDHPSLTVKEQDGTPSVSDVVEIRVSNGTLTDEGSGVVSISTGGGGGTTDHGALTGLSDDDHTQYVKDSEFDAKGDLLAGTGSDTFARLAVGTNGHVLTADSGEATGLKWAAASGGGSFSGAKANRSATQSLTNNTTTTLDLTGTDDYDTTGTYHFTSTANLTGTVSKTNGSATLTGSGTSFSSELTVGQVISVPGGSTERFVVTAIASNTSLTLSANAANTASGQTAARVASAIAIPSTGYYRLTAFVRYATNATGYRQTAITTNGGSVVSDTRAAATSSNETQVNVTVPISLAQYDLVEVTAFQTSGGALNVASAWLAVELLGT